MKLSSNFNQWEIAVHGGIWIGAVLISILKFYTVTKDINTHNLMDFRKGWIINTYQDVSDPEWSYYLSFIKQAIIPLFCHLTICEIFRWFNKAKYLTICYIAVPVCFILYQFTNLTAIIILLQPIIIHLFSKSDNRGIIWVGSIISLQIITLFKHLPFYEVDLQIDDVEHFTAVMAVFWTHLRCISYYLDVGSQLHPRNIVEMFAYALYFPTLFTGPFISYSDFKNTAFTSESKTNRLTIFIIKILRYGFWLIFIEFVMHFIYVNAIYFEIERIVKFDSWTLYGYGYCMGQYFHMKYVVMYGFSTAIAEFEGAKVPPTPKCIGRIHLYSDMWKHFDTGLYKFLLTYIYQPLIYSGSFLNKLVASFISFAFVFCWHGVQKDIFIWVSLNYFGILIELFCNYIYQTYLKRISVRYISIAAERRLISLITIPLLIMSAFSNFYFFAGIDIGNIFVYHLLHSDVYTVLPLIGILYSCCEICAFIKYKEMTRAIKKE